ncbi:MAG: hypothetical protein KGJ86_06360 [Chloroflexota bacterium]|nr:hypothetical protein [Chloroflexota bacterium]
MLNSGRSEDEGGAVDWDEAKAYCRDAGLVGVGWGLAKLPDGAPLETVLAAWHNEGSKVAVDTIARLAKQVEEGDLMWTRDRLGRYWLCQVTGPWRYDASDESRRLDLYNVRPCKWLARSFRDYDVPGAVVTGFTGVGQTLRRLGDHPTAIRVSELLWARESGAGVTMLPATPDQAMRDLLDPTDVEDVVLLYMQQQGWLLIPSSRMHDTPMYEAALRHKDSGELAVVSVKSGRSNPVPIPELAEAAGDARAYAYSTDGIHSASPSEYGVVEIEHQQLLRFMAMHPELLPPRVARWLQPARDAA